MNVNSGLIIRPPENNMAITGFIKVKKGLFLNSLVQISVMLCELEQGLPLAPAELRIKH